MDPKLLLGGLDSQGIKQLLDQQQLVDCTLACDGGKISAHKVVLSACSSYLAKILHEHPVEHPIIILPELKIEDVKTLVHYMYTGELLKSNAVNTNNLLRTAAILSVNSLNDFLNGTTNSDSNNNDSNNHNNSSSQQQIPPNVSFEDANLDSMSNSNLNGISNHSNNGASITTTTTTTTISGNLNHGDHNLQLNHHQLDGDNLIRSQLHQHQQPLLQPQLQQLQQQQLQQLFTPTMNIGSGNVLSASGNTITARPTNGGQSQINSLTGKSDFQFKCPVCQNDFQTICSFEYHMQRAHYVTSFGCEICHKPFASLRYVLTDHMRRCHGWKAEQKLQC